MREEMPANRDSFSTITPASFVNITNGTWGISAFNSRAASNPFITGHREIEDDDTGSYVLSFLPTFGSIGCIHHQPVFCFEPVLGSAVCCTISVAMLNSSLEEIRKLCAQITEEPNTAKVIPLLAKLRKLMGELQVTTNKIETR
jgi:hypothetical protein